MAIKGLSAKNIGSTPTIESLRDLVVNLDTAHSAAMAHLLKLQVEPTDLADLDRIRDFAVWVYYGSQITQSAARLRTAADTARKRVA